MVNISEVKARAHILDIWAALGGGELRGNRGQAFWRGGDGYSVSLDAKRGLWHDFVSGEGGDVIRLVETVHGCDFKQAHAWLADFTGCTPGETHHRHEIDHDRETDLRWAHYWRLAVEPMCERVLETLPSTSPQRYGPTCLLRAVKLGDESLLNEFRKHRREYPALAAALSKAGELRNARLQRRLALWIRSNSDGE